MKQISLFIPLLGTLLLSGCAGTSTEFECNATTSDTCMTMEQANEKAKKLEQSSEAKPVAASLPRLAEGNFRTMPVQTVTATTPSGSRPAVTAHLEQKLLVPRPLFTAAREVKTVVPVSSVTPVTPPRPLRTGEQTAALWIAPYIDIAYLSEIDPTWTDSSLTTILNPEAVIFANPIAQGACAADAIASAFNMPLDVLFWCAGSQGSMYPFNGWVSNESSPLQSSLLVSERMAFKLHRQGMIMETIGKNNAVCNEYPSPILPKERWRYQMVNMYPDSGQCHPFGRSVTRWETGKNPPNTKKNFGYLMWRKRNCVFL